MERKFKARCLKDRSWKTGFYLIKKKEPCIKDEKNVWPVHEQTICQSTGYLDCNKKEIFIGDLINFSTIVNSEEIKLNDAVVALDMSTGRLVLAADGAMIDFRNSNYKDFRYEIIGNVWDSIALPKKK